MLPLNFWLVIISSTLLSQCCLSQELSTIKTSSGRSSINAASSNSNISITPDSYSKSDTSFAASQNEVSQNESSLMQNENGISSQDSSYYSSNDNASGSSSNVVATDEGILQTESNFSKASSTTAESDSSFTATPNGMMKSSKSSSSKSTKSSSSITSRSFGGQLIESDGDGVDKSISAEDLPQFESSHQTKSLDFDFPENPPGSKPFPKFPPNFPKFPDTMNKNPFKSKVPYVPAGSFNSKLTPKIGTPVGPAGMSTPLLPNKNDDLINPFHNHQFHPSMLNSPNDDLLNSKIPTDFNGPLDSKIDSPFADSLPSELSPHEHQLPFEHVPNMLQSNHPEPFSQFQNSPIDDLLNSKIPTDFNGPLDSKIDSPFADSLPSELSPHEHQQPFEHVPNMLQSNHPEPFPQFQNSPIDDLLNDNGTPSGLKTPSDSISDFPNSESLPSDLIHNNPLENEILSPELPQHSFDDKPDISHSSDFPGDDILDHSPIQPNLIEPIDLTPNPSISQPLSPDDLHLNDNLIPSESPNTISDSLIHSPTSNDLALDHIMNDGTNLPNYPSDLNSINSDFPLKDNSKQESFDAHFPENDLLPNDLDSISQPNDSLTDFHPSPLDQSSSPNEMLTHNSLPHSSSSTDYNEFSSLPSNPHDILQSLNDNPMESHSDVFGQSSDIDSPYNSINSPLINDIPQESFPDSLSPEHHDSTDFTPNISQELYPLSDDINIASSPDLLSNVVHDDAYDEALKDSPFFSEDIPLPRGPYDSLTPDSLPSSIGDQPLSTGPTTGTMDSNHDGFISPEEILESNGPSSTPNLTPDIKQPDVLDSSFIPQPGYETNLDNLPIGKEHVNPNNFPSNDQPVLPMHKPSTPHIPLSGPNISSRLPGNKNYPNQLPQGPFSLNGPFGPRPFSPHSDFDMFPPSGYPRNKHFPYSNNNSWPRKSTNFPNDHSSFPSSYPPIPPYGLPFGPRKYPYDFSGNPFQPLPFNHPFPGTLSDILNPHFYNSPSPFSHGNPLYGKPQYSPDTVMPYPLKNPYLESPFDLPQRPHYKSKDWSKIPGSTSPNFSSPSTSDLDFLSPQNQNSLDIPPNSLLPLSPSPVDSSAYSPTPFDLDSNSPFTSQPPFDLTPEQPLTPLDLETNSPFTSQPLSDSSMGQSPTPLDLDATSPYSLQSPSDSSFGQPLTPFDVDTTSPYVTPESPFSPLSSLPSTPLNRNDIDDEIFDILKQRYEKTTSEYLLSNSIYPRDISSDIIGMSDEELTFDIVILGSSPAALSALKTLSETGKSILIIERGHLPPHISKSLYYRPKLLQSKYVRRIKSSAPYCDTEKILYAPNVLGEESTYDSNTWDYGVKSKYIKWGRLCKKWTWNSIVEYFTDGLDKPNTCAIPVAHDVGTTKATTAVTNIFNDAGLYKTEYVKGRRLEGLTVVPFLQENGENVLLTEKIFQQLTSYTNIKLSLGTIPMNIVFDNIGKAIGVAVKMPCGTIKMISIIDELIIGSNPIDTVQFLYQSGIGDHDKLQRLNIPTQINLPYVGKELIVTPLHFGVIYQFPQGILLSERESDYASMDYLFGRYDFPSALSVDYLKAALNIYESHEANIVFNFRVFSKSMSERLNSYIERLVNIDVTIKDFLTKLCQEYDLLLVVPQLTNVLSRGEIVIDNSNGEYEALVDTGMYKSKRDMTIMHKALKVLKSIAETETFKSMNGKVIQIPVQQCGIPDFSTEYNRCSIRYLSLPNLHYCGGTIMGVNPLTSVVNEDLIIHGTKNVRIFSPSVVPYGTSTDSSAVSSMIGNHGAHLIANKIV